MVVVLVHMWIVSWCRTAEGATATAGCWHCIKRRSVTVCTLLGSDLGLFHASPQASYWNLIFVNPRNESVRRTGAMPSILSLLLVSWVLFISIVNSSVVFPILKPIFNDFILVLWYCCLRWKKTCLYNEYGLRLLPNVSHQVCFYWCNKHLHTWSSCIRLKKISNWFGHGNILGEF